MVMPNTTRFALATALLLPALYAQGDTQAGRRTVPQTGSLKTSTQKLEVKGHLRKVSGIDLVFVHGSNAERGFAEGYLRAEALQAIFRGWAMTRINPRLWDDVILPRIEKSFTATPRSRERSAAIIEGMRARGTKYLEIPELKRKLEAKDLLAIPALIDLAGIMCSSVATWGEATKSGDALVCRNLDYSSTEDLLKYQAIFAQPGDGDRNGWISIGWSASWLLTGVSESGVFLAIHDVGAHTHQKQKHLPRAAGLTEVIERLRPGAKTAQRAADILAEFRYAYGGNGMLVWSKDRETGGAILEFGPREEAVDKNAETDRGVNIRYPEEDETHITCTNHHRRRSEPASCSRYSTLRAGLVDSERAAFDADSLWKLAAKARKSNTLQTVLVDFKHGTLRVEMRKAPHLDRWLRPEELDIESLFEEAQR